MECRESGGGSAASEQVRVCVYEVAARRHSPLRTASPSPRRKGCAWKLGYSMEGTNRDDQVFRSTVNFVMIRL